MKRESGKEDPMYRRGIARGVDISLSRVRLLAGLIAFSSCSGREVTVSEAEMAPVSNEEREMVVRRVSELLIDFYVFADVAEECFERINGRLAEGAYDDITRPNLFAAALNEDLRDVSGDKHLNVAALFGVSTEDDISRAFDELDFQHFLQRGNHGVIRVEWLRGNVGYLDLRAFNSLYVARHKFVSAMELLSDMDAIIIDLRKEVMGGPPETVQFLASYFFDEPTLIDTAYFRKDDVRNEIWTLENVPGTRMADVPLFILTDEDVFSAGEGFTYALQALGRATIVGGTTMGGAHITRPFRIGDRFEAKIPWGRPINPMTGTNWEGVGVEPDIQVDADKAFDVALALAREAADDRRAKREAQDIAVLQKVIEQIKQAESSFAREEMNVAASVTRRALERGMTAGLLNEGSIDDTGHYYLDRGDVDMAIEILTSNAEMHPESYNVHHSLADAYVQKGNRQRAVANLERSLELNPRNGWAVKLLENIDDAIAKTTGKRSSPAEVVEGKLNK
jgi:hypothetical protein